MQDGWTALHWVAMYSDSVAVHKAILAANPEAAKAKNHVRLPASPAAARRRAPAAAARSAALAPSHAAAALLQECNLPLHIAAWENRPAEILHPLIAAYPEALTTTTNVRRRRSLAAFIYSPVARTRALAHAAAAAPVRRTEKCPKR